MFVGTSLVIFVAGVLVAAADYGLKSHFPKLLIKHAGPSKHYPWVGYTSHYPRTIPRPLLLYKWNPYIDPTYTAFWVSHKHDGGGGHGSHGGGYGDGITEGKIPHGFGAPKPSSIADIINVVANPIVESPVDTYIEPAPLINAPLDSYEDHGEVIHISEDSYEDNVDVQFDTYTDPGPAIHVPVQTYIQPGHAVNILPTFIEPGKLVHAQEFSNAPKPVIQTEVIPLVKPPHSDPLPLENEGDDYNFILDDGFDIQGVSHP